MNSLKHFLNHSSQFKNISKTIFNNVYKIDHFAYRTFDIYNIIKKYSNYTVEKDTYHFKNNVSAKWLSNNNKPTIFVSQYNGTKCDEKIQSTSLNLDKLNYYTKKENILRDYKFYRDVSLYDQYLGWTLLFKNNINHIAFLVDDIYEMYDKIEKTNYIINKDIQVSKDENLLQFSIMSETIPYKFNIKTVDVPYTFIEFVQRKNNRVGFETENAEKIFESTKKI